MKIFKRIILVLFLLVSFSYIYIVMGTYLFPKFYPFGIRVAQVLTNSMYPTLEANDFVVIRKTDSYSVNDIVIYNDGESKHDVIHRIIDINGDEVITKGDANNKSDAPINVNQIKGIFIWKSSALGKVISYMNKPIVLTITITIIFIIMIINPDKNKKTKEKNMESNK